MVQHKLLNIVKSPSSTNGTIDLTNANTLLRFQRDEEGIPANKVKIWDLQQKSSRDHNEITEELILVGNEIL
jgi:hypothetical protein